MKVLFVCMGNICRSPLAVGVLRGLAAHAGLDGELLADSAGTHDYNVGSPPDARAAAAAAARGYSLAGMRARQVAASDFETFDLLLAMDRGNLAALDGACPPRHRHKLQLLLRYAREAEAEEIPDPYRMGPDGFERTLDLIESGVRGLLRRLAARTPAAARE